MGVKERKLSRAAAEALARVVPGGAHTYAKGPDQFPADFAPIISHGRGAHVYDLDGNRFIEYGSGLRSVALGHAYGPVLEAVRQQLERGVNFARPAAIELEAATRFLEMIPSAEMVKFAKNGSDATTAAVRLARAATGRDKVAICSDQPFFSTDDWFIGAGVMTAGIPEAVRELTLRFPYGDLPATEAMLRAHGGEVACLFLEVETTTPPPEGYLEGLVELAHAHGALVVFDEMITGFRWHDAGAQGLYGVTPDLSTFGKAMGNGFAVAALAGRRDLMERGGLASDEERVFLLSTTHGAESHALAAAIAVCDAYEREGVVERLHYMGGLLGSAVREVVQAAGLSDHIVVRGRPSNLVYATLDAERHPSQRYRTLFLRALLERGVLAPSFVVSAALEEEDVAHTAAAVAEACEIYKRALEEGDPTPYMGGRPVQPVFRRFA